MVTQCALEQHTTWTDEEPEPLDHMQSSTCRSQVARCLFLSGQVVPSTRSERELVNHGESGSAVKRNGHIARHVKTNEARPAQNRNTGGVLEES